MEGALPVHALPPKAGPTGNAVSKSAAHAFEESPACATAEVPTYPAELACESATTSEMGSAGGTKEGSASNEKKDEGIADFIQAHLSGEYHRRHQAGSRTISRAGWNRTGAGCSEGY